MAGSSLSRGGCTPRDHGGELGVSTLLHQQRYTFHGLEGQGEMWDAGRIFCVGASLRCHEVLSHVQSRRATLWRG